MTLMPYVVFLLLPEVISQLRMQMQVVYLKSDPEKVMMEWESETEKKRKTLGWIAQVLWDTELNLTGAL